MFGSAPATPSGTVPAIDPVSGPAVCRDITANQDKDKRDPPSAYNMQLNVCIANATASWIKTFIGASASYSATDRGRWQDSGTSDTRAGNFSGNEALQVREAVNTYLQSVGADSVIEIGKNDASKVMVIATRGVGLQRAAA